MHPWVYIAFVIRHSLLHTVFEAAFLAQPFAPPETIVSSLSVVCVSWTTPPSTSHFYFSFSRLLASGLCLASVSGCRLQITGTVPPSFPVHPATVPTAWCKTSHAQHTTTELNSHVNSVFRRCTLMTQTYIVLLYHFFFKAGTHVRF